MTFRTGHQEQLGNGSTLSILGFEPMETIGSSIGRPVVRRWVHFVAQIQCDKKPPTGGPSRIIDLHTRLIKTRLEGDSTMEADGVRRPIITLYSDKSAHNEIWNRIFFARPVLGPIYKADRLLKIEAHFLNFRQKQLEYVEYEWRRQSNEAIIDGKFFVMPEHIYPIAASQNLGIPLDAWELTLNLLSYAQELKCWPMISPGHIWNEEERGFWKLVSHNYLRKQEDLKGASKFAFTEHLVISLWRASLGRD